MSVFIKDVNLLQSSRTYRVILTHAPELTIVGQKHPGVYNFDLPPLLDNTNDTNYNQCYISLRKVCIDPVSIDFTTGGGENLRNPNPVWTAGVVGSDGMSVGQVIMEMSIPSKQVGSVQKRESTIVTIEPYNNLYRWQELIPLNIVRKIDFDGRPLGDMDFSSGTSTITGTRTMATGSPGSQVFYLDNDEIQMPGTINETGTLTQTQTVEGYIQQAGTGNTWYYEYQSKQPEPLLSANPFGSTVTVTFKDPFFGRESPIYLSDAARLAAAPIPDIGCISIELIITMVGDDRKKPER
tara:strand:- start:289 stop:1176 length:888 start_codon:yes stop_codon:yes gene_type:complete